MKKIIVLSVCALLVLGSCGTYTGMGAYTGSSIGSVLGSAIGGISNGPRGHDYGTIIGMAGGAIIGGAIGAKADQQRQDGYAAARDRVESRVARRSSGYTNREYGTYENAYDSSAYGTDGADDRLYDFDTSSSYTDVTASTAGVTVSNLRFVNAENDAILRSNQVSRVVFEVRNNTQHTLYNVQPVVEEVSGNKRVWISPSAYIENLAPGHAVRYTAMVSTGKLKNNGEAIFHVYVQHNGQVVADANQFVLNTQK